MFKQALKFFKNVFCPESIEEFLESRRQNIEELIKRNHELREALIRYMATPDHDPYIAQGVRAHLMRSEKLVAEAIKTLRMKHRALEIERAEECLVKALNGATETLKSTPT